MGHSNPSSSAASPVPIRATSIPSWSTSCGWEASECSWRRGRMRRSAVAQVSSPAGQQRRPHYQPRHYMCALHSRHSVGRAGNVVVAHLDWLRAVSAFVFSFPTGRHVDGRVEHSALGIVKVAKRVPRSLVALTMIDSGGSGDSQKRVSPQRTHNCVVWSKLIDVTAEEPPAAGNDAKKWSAQDAEKRPCTHEFSSGYSRLSTKPTRPLKLFRSPAPRLTYGVTAFTPCSFATATVRLNSSRT